MCPSQMAPRRRSADFQHELERADPYQLVVEQVAPRSWVPAATLEQFDAHVIRGVFRDPQSHEVVVHMPTERFWQLHAADPHASELWNHFGLDNYFRLPAWGPDLEGLRAA